MKLQAVPPVKSINIAAVEYTADADGFVDIPDEFAELAKAHGFAPITTPGAVVPYVAPVESGAALIVN